MSLSSSTSTTEDEMTPAMQGFFAALTLTVPICIGLGVGASSTLEDFNLARKKPIPVLIGLISQFVVMPLIALCLLQIFALDPEVAVGVVLVGSAPGGSASNLYTYFAQGDLALSVTMSLLSTLFAFFMMPLWSYLLITLAMGSENTPHIPLQNIAIVLVFIIVPTGVGLVIRHTNRTWKLRGKFLWKRVAQVATLVGFLALLGVSIIAIAQHYEAMTKHVDPAIWGMACLMLPLGTLFGLVAARLLRRTRDESIAISIETGIQNFALAVAVIGLSGDSMDSAKALQFPLAYGAISMIVSPLTSALYRFGWPKKILHEEDKDEDEEEDKANQKETTITKVEEDVEAPTSDQENNNQGVTFDSTATSTSTRASDASSSQELTGNNHRDQVSATLSV